MVVCFDTFQECDEEGIDLKVWWTPLMKVRLILGQLIDFERVSEFGSVAVRELGC